MKKIPLRKFKTFLKEPDLSDRFSIRDLGTFLGGKELFHELHRHEYFFLLVIEKGAGTHDIDFHSYPIHNHSVFFMRPGQVHQLLLKAGSKGYLIGFDRHFYAPEERSAQQLLQRLRTVNHCALNAAVFKKLIAPLHAAFQEYRGKQEGHTEVIKANLCIFYTELIRQRQGKNKQQTNVASYTQERFDEFLALLEADIFDHKEVAYYAGQMKLSAYQLNAITKTMLGKTSSQLINEQIILQAKRELLASAEQIKEIAYQLGYEDVSYFIRFFKKHTGYTPEAFRQHFK